ncbi:hypothetical protein GIB67_003600 [Kingdonia uniflora]|uniref:AT3G52170-like helix-turn-helix domain-containing protein n=1 Tax=Kingdonia uniflora TaxID=39325 RepID=A0A7J7MF41_9MAGN|nr:hypothetical protein GIB67_003600 [Kingdonia uniflora]
MQANANNSVYGISSNFLITTFLCRQVTGQGLEWYRISNAGKYPTAGTVKKQVGGSFYVIRLIVQELEYNSKMSSINKGNETLFDEVSNEERQPSIEAEEVSRSETIIDLTSSELSLGVEGDSNTEIIHVENIGTCNNLEAKEGSQASTWVEKPVIEEASNPTTKDDYSDSIGPQNLQMEQELKSRPLPESPEDTVIETVTIQSCQEAKGPKGDVMPETELDNYEREDISRKENKEEELPKKSTMWGNLKSFADGFINLWRKL